MPFWLSCMKGSPCTRTQSTELSFNSPPASSLKHFLKKIFKNSQSLNKTPGFSCVTNEPRPAHVVLVLYWLTVSWSSPAGRACLLSPVLDVGLEQCFVSVRCPARWARGWTVWQGSTVKNKCCRRAAQLPIVRSVCSACSFMYHEVRVFSVWLRCMSAVLTKTKASHRVPVLQCCGGFFCFFFFLTAGFSGFGFVHQCHSYIKQKQCPRSLEELLLSYGASKKRLKGWFTDCSPIPRGSSLMKGLFWFLK